MSMSVQLWPRNNPEKVKEKPQHALHSSATAESSHQRARVTPLLMLRGIHALSSYLAAANRCDLGGAGPLMIGHFQCDHTLLEP